MQDLLNFFVGAEKLKSTLHASWTSDSSRQESTADYSWMFCLLAMTLFEKITVPLNRERVLKMIILHDLAEAVTGDIPLMHQLGSFSHEDKHLAERSAMLQLLKPLDESTQQEFFSLWEENEKRETLEAKFVNAVDYLEGCLQYWVMDIEKWTAEDYKVAVYYRDERYQFDSFMREFKAFIDEKTMEKFIAAGKEAFLSPDLIEKYRLNRSSS